MTKDQEDNSSGKRRLTRRASWKVGTCGVLAMAAESSPAAVKEFYAGDAFDPKKAAEAYRAMMKRFGYPIPNALQTEQLWTCD